MNLKTCPNCGLENQEGYSFCTKCGTKLPAIPIVEPINNLSVESNYKNPEQESSYITPVTVSNSDTLIKDSVSLPSSTVSKDEPPKREPSYFTPSSGSTHEIPKREPSYYTPSTRSNHEKPSSESSYFTPSTFSSSRYAALRGIASFCNGLAKAIAAIAVLGGTISFFSSLSDDEPLIAFASLAAFAAVGGFCYVILRVIAEGISVLLDIEANTKTMATTSQEIYQLLDKESK